MGLTEKSLQLKELVSIYESKWFLGDLSDVIHSGRDRAADMLGKLFQKLMMAKADASYIKELNKIESMIY